MIDCSCKRECVCVVSECVSVCIERGVRTGGAEGSSMELHGGWGNVNQLERFERFFYRSSSPSSYLFLFLYF